jgi:hypothetical protein
MAENELLAQAVAEGMNLKAAGVSGPQDAREVRPQATPGTLPGDAATIAAQSKPLANDNAPVPADLAADLKAFASSPDGQALAQVKEKPMDDGPTRSTATQAVLADLKQFATPQGQERAAAPTPEQQPKR